MDAIVAQLNIDMIGRNRDDKASESNTVYLVGSDRISTELHEVNRAANAGLPKPLSLDYEFNDPADLEQIYFRSDHYSYAAKGVPIIFFTTGFIRTITRTPTRCRRSNSTSSPGSRSWCTRPACASPTSITRRCATTRDRGPAGTRSRRAVENRQRCCPV